MNKQEATRRVDKCIRKTSAIVTIRAVESGKRSLEQVAMSHVYSAVVSELEAENARLQRELDAARADMQALRDEVLALKVENRRVWDGFSVYYKVTGFEPTKRKVYIKGTVHGQSLLANDDDGTYTALYTLANEYASKKIEFGWVD